MPASRPEGLRTRGFAQRDARSFCAGQPFNPLLRGKLHKGFGTVRFLTCEPLIFDSELYAGNEVIHYFVFTISKED